MVKWVQVDSYYRLNLVLCYCCIRG